MKVFKTARLAVATCVLGCAGSSFASADIVFLNSGRTVSVKNHTAFGDSVVLTLRSGGQVTLSVSRAARGANEQFLEAYGSQGGVVYQRGLAGGGGRVVCQQGVLPSGRAGWSTAETDGAS